MIIIVFDKQNVLGAKREYKEIDKLDMLMGWWKGV